MLPGQLLNCRRTACKAHKLFVDGCARNASSTMVESGRAVFVPRLGHLRTLTSSRRSAQQQQHPLARRPTLGNASNGSGRTSSNPRLSDGKQTWSTATALLLATMTGATVSWAGSSRGESDITLDLHGAESSAGWLFHLVLEQGWQETECPYSETMTLSETLTLASPFRPTFPTRTDLRLGYHRFILVFFLIKQRRLSRWQDPKTQTPGTRRL